MSEQSAASEPPAKLVLGPYLRDVREGKRLSLRDVEQQTGGQIKSGYLSRLERGGILRPSPRILWLLADAYGLDHMHLMSMADYELPSDVDVDLSASLRGISLKSIAELDDDDRKLVREFVEILLARRKGT